ncbi:MAG TPA: hypothetical protein VG734_20045 [Lacunisphaera sp.]|nr:hypothetical protein [Lacunisphaera sp.]
MLRPVALLSCLALAGLSAIAGPLTGRMEGEQYVSATGEFRIRAPVLTELGGNIEDSESVVTFSDAFSTHVSIACFELDATQRWEFETRGRRDYLLYFFTDVVMANFTSRFPGSKVESARYLPDLLEGSIIAYSLLPGGSNFTPPDIGVGASSKEPVTAKRGTLLFVRNRHVYVVSTELAERSTQRNSYHQSVEQENEQLSARLIALAGRMTFTRDQPRKP